MFSSNNTPADEFVYARELGATINLDAYEDIAFLKSVTSIPKVISCRYNPGGVFELGTDIMDNPEEAKFGMTKGAIDSSLYWVERTRCGRVWYSRLLASNTVSNDYYPELARQLFWIGSGSRRENRCSLGFINLSGGVGVNYKPEQEPNDIAIIGEGVHRVLMRFSNRQDLVMWKSIPSLVALCWLHTVFWWPEWRIKKKTYRTYVGVDASAVNLLRPAMYGAYHHITNMDRPEEPTEVVDVVGSLWWK